jgi:hypothetical protein
VELPKPLIEARRSLHAVFAECGIDGAEGWEFFRILLNAVTKFTHAIFKPVNLVRNTIPSSGSSGTSFSFLHRLLAKFCARGRPCPLIGNTRCP